MKRNVIFLTSGPIGIVLLLIAPGCSHLEPADPDQARATLAQALDAWRDGRPIDDMNKVSPPITVSEPKWQAGYKLTSYEVAKTASMAGFDLKIPVELSLTDPQGKILREKARYTVSVEPARTVIRAPL